MFAKTLKNEQVRIWIAVIASCLGVFMAVLDIAIANSSMKNIQATLSTGINETSWISTSYIIAEIVTIPMTGWLIHVFSLRKYLIVNATLFLIFSMACGFSQTLPQLVLARSLQGLSGGALIPSASALILMRIPAAQMNIAIALIGISVAFAPSIGPALGGWITANYGWQWSFYINLVPGIITIVTLFLFLPYEKANLKALRTGDWWGICAMAVGLGTLTYIFERGNETGWFDDPNIRTLSAICAVAIGLFIFIELRHKKPFVDLRLLGNKNFLIANIASLSFGVTSLGNFYLIPRYLQDMQGYDALQSGRTMIWGGLPQLLVLPILPFILKKISAKVLAIVGFGFVTISSYWLGALMSHDMVGSHFIDPMIVRAMAMATINTALSVMAFAGIKFEKIGSAAGLFNMMRNLGGSLCIGLTSTFLDHRYRLHFSRLTEHVSAETMVNNPSVAKMSALPLPQAVSEDSFALSTVFKLLNRESLIMAYADWYYASVAVGIVAIIALLWVDSKTTSYNQAAAGH